MAGFFEFAKLPEGFAYAATVVDHGNARIAPDNIVLAIAADGDISDDAGVVADLPQIGTVAFPAVFWGWTAHMPKIGRGGAGNGFYANLFPGATGKVSDNRWLWDSRENIDQASS